MNGKSYRKGVSDMECEIHIFFAEQYDELIKTYSEHENLLSNIFVDIRNNITEKSKSLRKEQTQIRRNKK